jgi:hypothetical protein
MGNSSRGWINVNHKQQIDIYNIGKINHQNNYIRVPTETLELDNVLYAW